MESTEKISEKLYKKYSYLAKKYASKIFNYEEISFEYDDLVQEFNIKIYTSIKAYGRRWSKYRKGEASKPVPIKYYLEAACGNKSRDFMKYITRENNKVRIDSINYDFGINEETNICPDNNKFIVNGIDLLEGLGGKEKIIFSLFLKGHTKKILSKVYNSNKTNEIKKESGVSNVIENQKTFLIEKYGNELLQQNKTYSSYNINED